MAKAVEREPAPKKRKKRKKGRGRALGIVIFLLFFAIAVALLYFIFMVDSVQVTGAETFSEEEILQRSGISAGTHIWLVDARGARQLLEQDPHIRSAEIERLYPDTIRIAITERHARALVVGMSNVAVIDEEGYVMAIDDISLATLDIMRVSGIGSMGFQLNEQLGEQTDFNARALVQIIQAIDAAGLSEQVISLDMSNTLSVHMQTASGYEVLLGQPDGLEEKMEKLKIVLTELERLGYEGGVINLSQSGDPTYSPPRAESSPTNLVPPVGGEPDDGGDDGDGDGGNDGDGGGEP